MKVEIKIDSSYTEPKVVIFTDVVTDEVNEIIKKITESAPQIITGYKDEVLEILEQNDIFRIYTESGKVLAATNKGTYKLRLRIYELEERLERTSFVRISNSEIINLKKVKSFDLSFTGTICVLMTNGEITYVSRRYVTKIKQILGI